MIQRSHSVTATYPGHQICLSRQSRVEALENNLAATDTLISGSIYIYDLVEQRNLSGSCSVASMLGYQSTDKEPFGLARLIHPDDLSRVAEHFQKFTTLHYDEVIGIEYRMRSADGQWRWLRSQETPLAMAIDGFPLQILGIIQVMAQSSSSQESKSSSDYGNTYQVDLNKQCS